MKKIIAGVCTNLLITSLAVAENRIEGINITKEYEVPFSDNNLGVGVTRNEKIMSNDSGKLINNFSTLLNFYILELEITGMAVVVGVQVKRAVLVLNPVQVATKRVNWKNNRSFFILEPNKFQDVKDS